MSITKSQTEKINSIFNGNRFVIPTYQRKYSWTNVERQALWQDIEESIKDDMTHFVGTLSFKENKAVGLSTDTTYEIIDGQQRITTIFILLKVLIEKLDSQSQVGQLNAFIGSDGNLKLRPLGEDGDFLNKLLFHFEGIEEKEIRKRSQKFMYSAKKLFLAFVHPLSTDEVIQRIIFIKDRIEVLVFNVESQAQAVKMFSIINDRGLPLRILDKTKSILMLYSTLNLHEKLNDKINNAFEKIFDSYDDLLVGRDRLGILARLEENTIFTQHYYSARKLFPETWNYRNGAETIFTNLKSKCESLKDDSEKLEEFIISYVEDFEGFAVNYSNLVSTIELKPEYQKPFQYLEFTAILYPLIVRLFTQDKLDILLPLLEAIEVRIFKLRGTDPVRDMYQLSSWVAEWDVKVEHVAEQLINFSERFVSDHVLATYLDNPIAGNGAVKYILLEHCQTPASLAEYKDLQVEHIFSKEPNYEPGSYGFAEDYDYEKNRLGNLTLLEGSINKGLSNHAPINKVTGYLTSSIIETQNLAGKIQLGDFNKLSVDDRRKEIISFCLKRFLIVQPN